MWLTCIYSGSNIRGRAFQIAAMLICLPFSLHTVGGSKAFLGKGHSSVFEYVGGFIAVIFRRWAWSIGTLGIYIVA